MNRTLNQLAVGGALLLSVTGMGIGHVSAHQEAVHPAHIHNGTCDALADVVAPLNDVASTSAMAEETGTPVAAVVGQVNPVETDSSVTTVPMALTDLLAGQYAINVHRSADDISDYISCGEIGGTMIDATDLAVALRERNNSRESGIAYLHDNGDGTTTVTLMLVQNPAAPAVATQAVEGAVTVTLSDMHIATDTTSLKVGVPYTFVSTNNGAAIHELVIEHFGDVDKPLAEAADIIPGSTATLPFTFTEPGKYQLACHQPGHYEAGMVIEIDVTA